MKYDVFKITMETARLMVKKGLNKGMIDSYLRAREIKITDKMVKKFISDSKKSTNSYSVFEPDYSFINAVEVSEKAKSEKKR